MLAEVWPFVRASRAAGEQVALARVLSRTGTAGRPTGAAMAVTAVGRWTGSVAGGCVDGDVLTAAAAVLAGGAAVLLKCDLGPDSRPEWEAGPACSGTLSVLVGPLFDESVCSAVDLALGAAPTEPVPDSPLLLATSLTAPYGTVVGPGAAGAVVEAIRPGPRLILVGATDVAVHLAAFAAAAGFRVVVLEPRPAYADRDRVPDATLVRAWPSSWLVSHALGPDDALIALTHEPRLDDAALAQALLAGCGFVAAIGSRTTHHERLIRLSDVPGVSHIHGPAGLDLGAGSSVATALSMLAEVIAVRNGRDGGPLERGSGRVRAR